MTGWRKRTIMEMALEAGIAIHSDWAKESRLERFAALVRADERNCTWTQQHWTDYELSIAAAEREACLNCYSPDDTATDWTDKIKARGQACLKNY